MAVGFIALHRKIRDNWVWKDPVRYQWWTDMLLEANWEAEPVRVELGGTHSVMCGRGQICFSVLTWQSRWRATRQAVRSFFQALEATNMITIETTTKTTIITICNYDSYNNPATNKTTTKKPAQQPQYNNPNNSIPTSKEVVYSEAEKISFAKFQEFIKNNAEEVGKMKQPFTIVQYLKIRKKLVADTFPGGKDAGLLFLKKIIVNMGDWTTLHKRRSAYLTFLNWAERDLKNL